MSKLQSNVDNEDFRIKGYIESALKCEKYLDFEITLTDLGEKSDGYAGHFIFATVLAKTAEGLTELIEIAVKCSKNNFFKIYRNLYKREAYVYEVILTEFIKFQRESNITDAFDSVPKFYKAISETSAEILVMENLRKSGYRLYDRKRPLDINHLKCVLREYGKFHAISFALREKKADQFKKIVKDFDDIILEFIDENFKKMVQLGMKRTCDAFEKVDDKETYTLCLKPFRKGSEKVLTDILESTEPDSAILHGDCWNNNFVYKYESEESECPSKVAILDWQVSRLHSPVLDVSYFIYSTSSEEQLEHFDELLNTYYDSFSTFLKDFGCEPEELFPFSTLKNHWKKYALFGIIMVTTFLHVTIYDAEKSSQLDDKGDETDLSIMVINTDIQDQSEYQKRLVAVVGHYCRYVKEL